MEYLLIIFFLGVLTPIQTAANSRLRLSVGSPLVASFVQFVVGSVFLAVATLIERGDLFFSTSLFSDLPFWAWLGGLCGVYALTVNIIIFPKLGSIQTVLMPMLGQISMGLLIERRLEKAAELLSKGLSVTDTYIQVGFRNRSHFTKLFTSKYNCPPSALAKRDI